LQFGIGNETYEATTAAKRPGFEPGRVASNRSRRSEAQPLKSRIPFADSRQESVDARTQSRNVEAMRGVVLGRDAVSSKRPAPDPEGQDPLWTMCQRFCHRGSGRTGKIRLDQHDVGTRRDLAQRPLVERMHRGRVEQVDPTAGDRFTDPVEHGSNGNHRAGGGALAQLDLQPAAVRRPRARVGGVGEAQVRWLAPGGGIPQQRLRFIRVSRHVQAPARQGREAGDVSGGVVRVAAGGPVMACPDGDQDRADTLVTEIELHLLECTLHEKRGVGVHDRAKTLEGMACGDSNQELLSDAQVAQSFAVAARGAGGTEPIDTDVREQQHDPRIRVEQIRRDGREAVSHRFHPHPSFGWA